MPENLHLSQEMAQEIVREAHPERELSQSEIQRLASSLNQTLCDISEAKNVIRSRHSINYSSK